MPVFTVGSSSFDGGGGHYYELEGLLELFRFLEHSKSKQQQTCLAIFYSPIFFQSKIFSDIFPFSDRIEK